MLSSVLGYFKYIFNECSCIGFCVKLNSHFSGIKCPKAQLLNSVVMAQIISYKYILTGSVTFL